MTLRELSGISILLLIQACASVKAPEGGPKDGQPPILISAIPGKGTIQFNGKAIILDFNEEVSESNSKQQFLSPVTPVTVIPTGRRLKITADSGWKENTTYVLNLNKKIKDDHEGNLLADTMLIFSTGTFLDSLKLTVNIRDKAGKPGFSKYTGLLHSNIGPTFCSTTDSLKPLEIQGLPTGDFLIEIFQDKNENYKYDEEDGPVFVDSLRIDSSITMTIKPLPQKFTPIKVFKQRNGDTVQIEFSRYALPERRFMDRCIAFNESKTLFSLYPVKENLIYAYSDSIRNCYQDTIDLARIDSGRTFQEIPLRKTITLEREGKNLEIKMDWNWAIDRAPQSLEITQDSIFRTVPFKANRFSLEFNLTTPEPGKLIIHLDTLGFFNKKGWKSDSTDVKKLDLETKGLVSGKVVAMCPDHILQIQILNEQKIPVATSTGKDFRYHLKPGKYTLIAFADLDLDGYYTGGNKKARRKAEPLYQHPEPIELRPGWDLEKITIPSDL